MPFVDYCPFSLALKVDAWKRLDENLLASRRKRSREFPDGFRIVLTSPRGSKKCLLDTKTNPKTNTDQSENALKSHQRPNPVDDNTTAEEAAWVSDREWVKHGALPYRQKLPVQKTYEYSFDRKMMKVNKWKDETSERIETRRRLVCNSLDTSLPMLAHKRLSSPSPNEEDEIRIIKRRRTVYGSLAQENSMSQEFGWSFMG